MYPIEHRSKSQLRLWAEDEKMGRWGLVKHVLRLSEEPTFEMKIGGEHQQIFILNVADSENICKQTTAR